MPTWNVISSLNNFPELFDTELSTKTHTNVAPDLSNSKD